MCHLAGTGSDGISWGMAPAAAAPVMGNGGSPGRAGAQLLHPLSLRSLFCSPLRRRWGRSSHGIASQALSESNPGRNFSRIILSGLIAGDVTSARCVSLLNGCGSRARSSRMCARSELRCPIQPGFISFPPRFQPVSLI